MSECVNGGHLVPQDCCMLGNPSVSVTTRLRKLMLNQKEGRRGVLLAQVPPGHLPECENFLPWCMMGNRVPGVVGVL